MHGDFGDHGHAICRLCGVKPTGSHVLLRADGIQAATPTPRSEITVLGTVVLALIALGGLNWALIGLAGFHVVAWLFGPTSVAARAIDVLFGLAALYGLARLPHWSRAG